MKIGIKPQFQTKTNQTQFLIDAQNLFAEKQFGHMGNHRFSKEGLELWNKISQRAKKDGVYYIFSDEVSLIEKAAPELLSLLPHGLILIDNGPGTEEAMRDKLGNFIKKMNGKISAYVAIDAVPEIVKDARRFFQQEFPEIDFIGLENDFFQDQINLPLNGTKLSVVFGQTMFNLPVDPREKELPHLMVVSMLRRLKSNISDDDFLLITQDCNRDKSDIVQSYKVQNDIWMNVLQRIKVELPVSDEFDPNNFTFEPHWIEETNALSHTFVAKKSMQFSLGDQDYTIESGQRFYLHNSYKFPVETFLEWSKEAGLETVYSKQNEKRRIALHLFQKTLT